MDCTVREIIQNDIVALTETFTPWNKKHQWFERYFEEHQQGKRVTLVAFVHGMAIGYGNVLWESEYKPFRQNHVPEINDLGVIDEYQNCGIGRALIYKAECVVARTEISVIGIGVGQTPEYAAAQYLYPKLGFVPDGRGICPTQYGDVIFLTKKL